MARPDHRSLDHACNPRAREGRYEQFLGRREGAWSTWMVTGQTWSHPIAMWESAHYQEECPLRELETVFLSEDWFMVPGEATGRLQRRCGGIPERKIRLVIAKASEGRRLGVPPFPVGNKPFLGMKWCFIFQRLDASIGSIGLELSRVHVVFQVRT